MCLVLFSAIIVPFCFLLFNLCHTQWKLNSHNTSLLGRSRKHQRREWRTPRKGEDIHSINVVKELWVWTPKWMNRWTKSCTHRSNRVGMCLRAWTFLHSMKPSLKINHAQNMRFGAVLFVPLMQSAKNNTLNAKTGRCWCGYPMSVFDCFHGCGCFGVYVPA